MIGLYQAAARPFMAPCCRFAPSCSDYAKAALEVRGLGEALLLILTRVARCHPFHPGGFDPLPSHE